MIKKFMSCCCLGNQLTLCYIIKEWYFYIIHFSLIVFYHSVSLGSELFRLRVQGHSHWEQFYAARKGYDNHHCHNKPQTVNRDGVWMTSYLEEIVLRIWGFWKKMSWKLTLDHGGRQLSSLPLRPELEIRPLSRRVEFFGSLPAEMNWDLKHHKMCRTLGVGLA